MDGNGRNGFRDSRAERDDARDIRGLHRLGDAAEDHFVDESRIETGAGEERTDNDPPKLVCGEFTQISAGFAKRAFANHRQ